MGARKYLPSQARAQEIACPTIRLNGDTDTHEKEWTPKFIKQNILIASVIGRRVQGLGISGASRTALEAFY